MNKVSRLVLLICLTSAVSGQTPEPIRDFPIGVGDLLELSVYGVPDFSRSIRVNSSGKIRLPFLGEIQAGGLTLSELEISLTDLLDPDYVKDPQVSIFAKEPRSRMFSILGAVKSPGKYQMLEPIKLVTAISEAGGLDLTRAGNEVVIQRVTPSTPESNETAPGNRTSPGRRRAKASHVGGHKDRSQQAPATRRSLPRYPHRTRLLPPGTKLSSQCLKFAAKQAGVPRQSQSYSLRPTTPPRRGKQALVVTSWWHSRRALSCFKHFGRDIKFYSAPAYKGLRPAVEPRLEEFVLILIEYVKIAWYGLRYGIWSFSV